MYRLSELREWHSLLLEKGLRVRLEIDPFIEGEGVEEDAERWIEDAPLEDAVAPGDTVAEELLREREELKPY